MSGDPRVLLFSERNIEAPVWQGATYDFEDIIAEVDDVSMLAPAGTTPSLLRRQAEELGRRIRHMPDSRARQVVHQAVRHFRRPDLVTTRTAEPVNVTTEHELFFAVFTFPTDIVHAARAKGWRERCDKAACFIIEAWGWELESLTPYIRLLGDMGFDHIFVANPAIRERITQITGVPCTHVPVAIDTLSFCPYPSPPERTVDFYQFGRRSAITHEAVLDYAARSGRFYVYDTVVNPKPADWRQHRRLIISFLQRAQYFFAYRIGQDRVQARGEDSLSGRYFEGAAAGTIMLGSPTDTWEWAAHFDWPDSVIEIPYEATNFGEIVEELDAQPERLQQARLANMANALRRHDWTDRWGRMLADLGMPQAERLAARQARAEERAALVEAG